jgi:hypothetical protein
MAISVDWATKVISVPKADLTLIDIGPPEIRGLNLDTFRLTLKDLEDGEIGMPFDDTHSHITQKTLQGDTYARIIEFINGYTIEFEDGQYTVRASGANSNLSDVKVQNQVSIDTRNSGGLIQLTSGELDVASDAFWERLDTPPGTAAAATKLSTIQDSIIIGTVDESVFTPTKTEFEAGDITDALPDQYKGAIIKVRTGPYRGAVSDVEAYALVGGKGHFTVTGLPAALPNGTVFLIV